jgi:hypothetical protein
MYLEQSSYTRKNLVVASAGDCCTSGGAPSLLQIVDPGTGTVIWQSPPLLGPVSTAWNFLM